MTKRPAAAAFAVAGLWAVVFIAAALLAEIRPWRRTEILVVAAVFALTLSPWAWRYTRWLDPYSEPVLRVARSWWRRAVTVTVVIAGAVIIAHAYVTHQTSTAKNLVPVLDSLSGVTLPQLRARSTHERYPFLWFGDRSVPSMLEHAEILRSASTPTWSDDAFNSRSQPMALHAMAWLDDLLVAYRETREIEYLHRAEHIVMDWIARNSTYLRRPPSEFSWNDHSTALRATVWVRYWEAWRRSPLWSEDKANRFLSSMFAHAAHLADPTFYTRRHNHGMDQDIALLAIAAAFPDHKRSRDWIDLAARRVREQIEHLVSPNGVQLEHSPAYQLTTLAHLDELQRFSQKVGISIDAHGGPLAELLRKMADVATVFILPDGRLAPIGDTWPETMLTEDNSVLGPFAERSAMVRYVLSAGTRGRTPPALTTMKDDGYAVVRRGDLYLLFTAASNKSLSHKHEDDLSFILYACGRTLVDEGGHISYQPDEERAFTVGPYAQNSVVIGSPQPEPWRNGSGRARLTRAERHDRFIELSGVTHEHRHFTHARTLLLIDHGALVVLDHVTPKPLAPKAETTFTQLFNVRDESAIKLEVLAPVGAAVKRLIGQRTPMVGWRAEKFGGTLQPSPALAVQTTGTSATIASVIRFEAECGRGLNRSEVAVREKADGTVFVEWADRRGVRQKWQTAR